MTKEPTDVPDPMAIGADIALKGVATVAPKGLKKLTNWIRGRRILVVGQGRSGKTSFISFLETDTLFDEGYHQRSYGWGKSRDKEHRKTWPFTISQGRGGALQLRVRSAIDVVGQATADRHGRFVREHRPHGLVIMTDLTLPAKGPDGVVAWLKDFLDQLADELRADARLRRSLKSIVVVLNKADRVDEAKVRERRELVKGLMTQKLGPVLGQAARRYPVMPCILIDHPSARRLAGAVVAKLAHTVSETI